jgi:hypothetical protein
VSGNDASSVLNVRTLLVAAGGGGDAITSAALSRPLGLTELPVIMTYSWDRLMVDPLPGPRRASDFTELCHLGPHTAEIVTETRATPPAGSSLPRLAAQLPARLVLLDPTAGAVGMATQLTATAVLFEADNLTLVDVGGDILTNGDDPGLRSPLADQLALAACLRTGLPTRLVVAAPSIDGEIDPDTLRTRLDAAQAHRLQSLDATDIAPIRQVFTWHPSEASGLLAAAANGSRGRVEVRDAGDQVLLTDDTPSLHAIDLAEISDTTPGAALTDSDSLDEACNLIRRLTGISEIDYETAKAARRNGQPHHAVTVDDLQTIDQHAQDAARRGADYISMRRLSELIGATTLDAYADLGNLIATQRPARYAPSIYSTTAESGSK